MLGNARSIFILFSVGLIFLLVACSGGEGNVTVTPSPSPSDSEEVESPTDAELGLRFNDAVEEYVKTTWSTWTLGGKMGQCLVANASSLTTEAKEAIIKHGVEEAFDELSGVHLQSLSSV